MKVFFCNLFSGVVMIAAVCQFSNSIGVGSDDDDECYVQNRVYKSGQRIPKEEACHMCLCFRGRVDCFWLDCPPPPDNCEEMILEGECNPILYICPIPRELTDVPRTWVQLEKRTMDVQPSDSLMRNGSADCRVLGVPYKTGDLMGVASHPCLECRCARDELYCSPKCCFSPVNVREKPSSVMTAISRGSKIPQEHPLEYLKKELDELLWNS